MGPSCYIEYRGIRNRTIRGFYRIEMYPWNWAHFTQSISSWIWISWKFHFPNSYDMSAHDMTAVLSLHVTIVNWIWLSGIWALFLHKDCFPGIGAHYRDKTVTRPSSLYDIMVSFMLVRWYLYVETGHRLQMNCQLIPITSKNHHIVILIWHYFITYSQYLFKYKLLTNYISFSTVFAHLVESA